MKLKFAWALIFILGLVVFFACILSEKTAGNRFRLPSGYVGVYCIWISEKFDEAPVDNERFTVFDFDASGMAHSSTFPVGKGGIDIYEYETPQQNRIVENGRSCGAQALVGESLVIGVVGYGACPEIVGRNSKTIAEAVQNYCVNVPTGTQRIGVNRK